MATSTQSSVFKNLNYSNEIKDLIIQSGGTIVFMKDNLIIASEISEDQYRELLKNPYINKVDVLPLKRFKNEGIIYNESSIENFESNTVIQNIINNTNIGV